MAANYRRNFLAGGSYFFTVNLAEGRRALLTEHIAFLRAACRQVRLRHPFAIEAALVLPDHLHMIWSLQEGDANFATRWGLIKAGLSRNLPFGEAISVSRSTKRERGIWQRRYWEHTIRNEADFTRHLDYIHFNPVKHGYVPRVRDWLYSSFHRWVRLGAYPDDWASDNTEDSRPFGER
jgi:putative transposase